MDYWGGGGGGGKGYVDPPPPLPTPMVGIWCKNDVVSTSMRRNHVITTSLLRNVPAGSTHGNSTKSETCDVAPILIHRIIYTRFHFSFLVENRSSVVQRKFC